MKNTWNASARFVPTIILKSKEHDKMFLMFRIFLYNQSEKRMMRAMEFNYVLIPIPITIPITIQFFNVFSPRGVA